MNRRDRFHAAVRGRPADRPPVCVWMHFVTPYMDGATAGSRHCEFIRRYGWDVAKAVSDYRYPFPEGMLTVACPGDMQRIARQGMDHPTFANQLALLRAMRADLGEDWPVVDTTFSPLQQVVRYAGATAQKVILDHPASARPMLERVTETVIRYVRQLPREGVDAVFYSTWAAATERAPRGCTQDAFAELIRPYDIAILDEAAALVRILHACKSHLDLGRVADYPHEVLSWAASDPTCPGLAEMRARTDACLMAGLDQMRIVEQSIPEIRRDMAAAMQATGGHKFILAPGCTIPSNVPDHVLATIAESLH
jgi:uroporphyrinogen decarboxylase